MTPVYKSSIRIIYSSKYVYVHVKYFEYLILLDATHIMTLSSRYLDYFESDLTCGIIAFGLKLDSIGLSLDAI